MLLVLMPLCQMSKPHELKHTTTIVHDQGAFPHVSCCPNRARWNAGLQQAKLEREIKSGQRASLKHVPSPKVQCTPCCGDRLSLSCSCLLFGFVQEGLSKEQLATLMEEEKAAPPAAPEKAAAPAAAKA